MLNRLSSRIYSNTKIQRICSAIRVIAKRFCIRDLTIGKKLTLGRWVVIETHRSLAGVSTVSIGDNCTVEDSVRLEAWGGHISIGSDVFVGPQTIVYGHGNVRIGNSTLISMQCRILSSNHTVPPMGTPIRSVPNVLKETSIGNDVWIGAGATVLGGVGIGDGVVVGAGAVVTHDIPAGAIALGVPAKVVGWREHN